MKQWELGFTQNYQPSVAILVPAYNEEKTIQLKLRNLSKIDYPAEKIETVIVNDASTDNTLKIIHDFRADNPYSGIKLFDCKNRLGKAGCLNQALESVAGEIVIISDADCFWPLDILKKALPYLSDPEVGAITVRELLLNSSGSWMIEGEDFYNTTMQSIRIGESKAYSTIFFHGGFAAFKRKFLTKFNNETDDSGTAMDIVQRGGRSLLTDKSGFYTMVPASWRSRMSLKIRRADHLQNLWIRCLKLLLRGQLVLPKKIAIPEAFLFLFNPFLLLALAILTPFVIIQSPIFLLGISLLLILLLFRKTRVGIVEALQGNLTLFLAMFHSLASKTFEFWKTSQETRNLLTEEILRKKQLI
jgi:cellulose synthase/poly-beta-1,6-N-acetylglucosamine synthase-like glycosyltransferase